MNKIKMYHNLFDSRESIEEEFQTKLLDDVEILFAWYSYEDYSGNAVVIYKQKNKLYAVYGSHCSCYGLGGQWNPEETSIKHLKKLFIEGSYDLSFDGDEEAKDNFRKLIEK